MNDKPILYEDKIKDRDNDFLYNKCISQYHQLMNCQYKNKEYKNKINNLQSKIDKAIDKINLYELITGYYDSNYDGYYDTYSHEIKEELLDILKEDK